MREAKKPLQIRGNRPRHFLRQRIDIAVQRGNALSILSTFLIACAHWEASILQKMAQHENINPNQSKELALEPQAFI